MGNLDTCDEPRCTGSLQKILSEEGGIDGKILGFIEEPCCTYESIKELEGIYRCIESQAKQNYGKDALIYNSRREGCILGIVYQMK